MSPEQSKTRKTVNSSQSSNTNKRKKTDGAIREDQPTKIIKTTSPMTLEATKSIASTSEPTIVISQAELRFSECQIGFEERNQVKFIVFRDSTGEEVCSFGYQEYDREEDMVTFRGTNTGELIKLSCSEPDDFNELWDILEAKDTNTTVSSQYMYLLKIKLTVSYSTEADQFSFTFTSGPTQLFKIDCKQNHIEIDRLLSINQGNLKLEIGKCNIQAINRFICSELREKRRKELKAQRGQEVRSAFECHFAETESYKSFRTYVEECCKRWAIQHNIIAPIGTIVQSSGHGKSRCMSEFAKNHLSIYICLRKPGVSGFPKSSIISRTMLDRLSTKNTCYEFLYALVKAAMWCLDKVKAESDEEKTVHQRFYDYQPWIDPESYECMQFVDYFKKQLIVVSGHRGTKAKEFKQIYKEIRQFLDAINEPLYFFFDEARVLTSEYSSEADYAMCEWKPGATMNLLGVMRRCIRELFEGQKVAFILADTEIQPNPFVHSESKYVGSERNAPKKLYEPFYKVFCIDQYNPQLSGDVDQDIVTEFTHFKAMKDIDYKYLSQINAKHTTLLLGRPLWSSLICHKYKLADIFLLAQMKLLNNDPDAFKRQETSKYYGYMAMLCSRTTYSLTQSFRVGRELIARHMSTLYYMGHEQNEIGFRYFSEPILAHAAAKIMLDNDHLDGMLTNWYNDLSGKTQEYSGAIGEVVAELLILIAYDRAHRRFAHFKDQVLSEKPITVERFLTALVGEDNFGEMNLDSKTKNGLVFFNHFVQAFGDLSREDVIDIIKACAAVQYKTNQPHFDLAVFFVLEDDTISAIRFQIKNWNESVPEAYVQNMVPKPRPTVPYVSILMNLGQLKPTSAFEAVSKATALDEPASELPYKHYQLNGFGAFQNSQIPANSLEKLQELVNIGRLDDIDRVKNELDKKFRDTFTAQQVYARSLTTKKRSEKAVSAQESDEEEDEEIEVTAGENSTDIFY